MNFAFSPEQEEFRTMLARFAAERCSLEHTRRISETDSGYDAELWKQMAQELGLTGVAIPESYGGQGYSYLELGLALEQLGRTLAGGPLFATCCLAAPAIVNAGSEDDKKELLPGIAAGKTIATLAVSEGSAQTQPSTITATCRESGGQWQVSGAKSYVVDAQNADLIIIAAREAGSTGSSGISLIAVQADAPGVVIEPVDSLDPTRRLAHVKLDDVAGRMLGSAGQAWPALSRTLDQAAILLTAEQVGGAARCLDMAVQYSKERIQFGRQIGSFQAIKHRAAAVKLDLELARSAAYWSWWIASEHDEELEQAASIARSVCSDAYLHAAAENIHIHGGMGFTWEADPHLYYRRAKWSATLLGDPTLHRARIADSLGFGA